MCPFKKENFFTSMNGNWSSHLTVISLKVMSPATRVMSPDIFRHVTFINQNIESNCWITIKRDDAQLNNED